MKVNFSDDECIVILGNGIELHMTEEKAKEMVDKINEEFNERHIYKVDDVFLPLTTHDAVELKNTINNYYIDDDDDDDYDDDE